MASLVMTMLEAAKGYFGIIVARYNTIMRETMNPEDQPKTHIIGFNLPTDEEETLDEEIL